MVLRLGLGLVGGLLTIAAAVVWCAVMASVPAVHALRLTRWDVDVRVFGVAAHSLSVPLPPHKHTGPNGTRPDSNPSPFDESATPSTLMSYYQVALISAEFDEPVFVRATANESAAATAAAAAADGDEDVRTDADGHVLLPLSRVGDPRALHGITRLICDTALIESHPPHRSVHKAAAAPAAAPRASDPLEFGDDPSAAATIKARTAGGSGSGIGGGDDDDDADAGAEDEPEDELVRFSNRKFRSRPPLFLVPFVSGYSDALPLLSLIEAYLRPPTASARADDAAEHSDRTDRTYTVALVLGYTHLNALDAESDAAPRAREDVRVLTEAELGRCGLHFLKATSQGVAPPRQLMDKRGVAFEGRIAHLRPPTHTAATAGASEWSWRGAASSSVHSTAGGGSGGAKDESCAFPTLRGDAVTRGGQLSAAERRKRTTAQLRATLEPTLRALLATRVPALLEVETHSQVQYKGLVDALVTPVINGVKSVFSMIVSSAAADTLVEPVVNHVVSGIGEAVVAHLEPFVSGKVIENVVPATTESIADTVTQTVSEALSDMMAEMMVEPVTGELTELLSNSVPRPVSDRVATESALKIAHKLTHVLTHTLSRSLSHSIVGSLIHSVTQNPLMDYYCYYCSKFQRYCFYCRRSPRQLYYALYYTGYFSSYYSQYYTDVYSRKMGVKVVRRKTIHDFGDEPRVDETFVDKAVYDRLTPNHAHWIY